MVFGDRGDEIVERRNAEVLMRGAQLALQFGGAALGGARIVSCRDEDHEASFPGSRRVAMPWRQDHPAVAL